MSTYYGDWSPIAASGYSNRWLPVINVGCPYCYAQAGHRCVTRTGNPAHTHNARYVFRTMKLNNPDLCEPFLVREQP